MYSFMQPSRIRYNKESLLSGISKFRTIIGRDSHFTEAGEELNYRLYCLSYRVLPTGSMQPEEGFNSNTYNTLKKATA